MLQDCERATVSDAGKLGTQDTNEDLMPPHDPVNTIKS